MAEEVPNAAPDDSIEQGDPDNQAMTEPSNPNADEPTVEPRDFVSEGQGDDTTESSMDRSDAREKIANQLDSVKSNLGALPKAVRKKLNEEHGEEFQKIEDELKEEELQDPQELQQARQQNGFDMMADMIRQMYADESMDSVRQKTKAYKRFDHSVKKINKKLDETKESVMNDDINDSKVKKDLEELNTLIEQDLGVGLSELEATGMVDEGFANEMDTKFSNVEQDLNGATEELEQANDIDLEPGALESFRNKFGDITEQISEYISQIMEKLVGSQDDDVNMEGGQSVAGIRG